MYALYLRENQPPDTTRYRFVQEVSLYGCNVGYIPKLLRPMVPAQQCAPFRWHLPVAAALIEDGKPGHALVINLKPKSVTPNLSLYEIVDVWGFTWPEWTPIMMRLRSLFIDENPAGFDEKDFVRRKDDIEDPIFSMMYLHGSVYNGKLTGRWTTPGASPTNSVLLWPENFTYFADEAKRVIDEFSAKMSPK